MCVANVQSFMPTFLDFWENASSFFSHLAWLYKLRMSPFSLDALFANVADGRARPEGT